MSRLKISPNLAIGFAELLFLQKSLSTNDILTQFVSKFGIIRRTESYNSLRVTASTSGPGLRINSGVAIDRDFNVITIPFTPSIFTIPEDGEDRFVVVKFTERTIEKEKVNIQSDGLVTLQVQPGGPTLQDQIDILSVSSETVDFSERVRGGNAFHSKIRFPNSTINTGEYFVKSIIDEETLLLNVGVGVLRNEENVEYEVVGSFTPGTIIPEESKKPFVSDGYSIELRDSQSVSLDREFLLAKVNYDNGNLNIDDLRYKNLFKINSFLIEDTLHDSAPPSISEIGG